MRGLSKSYSLQIAIHAFTVIVLFGASSGPPSTDTNSMGFRTTSFKHAPSTDTNSMGFRTTSFKHVSLNSSRDRSARKSSICETVELLSCFPFRIASYVCLPVVVNRTFFFFHMQHKHMGSTYAFPQLESHYPEVLLYTRGASESRFAFLIPEDQEALLPCHPQKGKIHFHPKTKTPAPCVLYGSHSKVTINMLFSEVVLRSGKLNWDNLDMPLLIAMSCILWKQPEKIELWQ